MRTLGECLNGWPTNSTRFGSSPLFGNHSRLGCRPRAFIAKQSRLSICEYVNFFLNSRTSVDQRRYQGQASKVRRDNHIVQDLGMESLKSRNICWLDNQDGGQETHLIHFLTRASYAMGVSYDLVHKVLGNIDKTHSPGHYCRSSRFLKTYQNDVFSYNYESDWRMPRQFCHSVFTRPMRGLYSEQLILFGMKDFVWTKCQNAATLIQNVSDLLAVGDATGDRLPWDTDSWVNAKGDKTS